MSGQGFVTKLPVATKPQVFLAEELSKAMNQVTFLENELSEFMREFHAVENTLARTITRIKEIEYSMNACRNHQSEAGMTRKKKHIPILLNKEMHIERKTSPKNPGKKLQKLMGDMESLQRLKNKQKREMSNVRTQVEILNDKLWEERERKEDLEEELKEARRVAMELERAKAHEAEREGARKREAEEVAQSLKRSFVASQSDTEAPSPPPSPASSESSGSSSPPTSPSGSVTPTSPIPPTGLSSPELESFEKLLGLLPQTSPTGSVRFWVGVPNDFILDV